MAPLPTLWSVAFSAPAAVAEALSEAIADGALSLTTVAPPRTDKADIEAIFDAPPEPAPLQLRLAILAALHDMPAPKLHIKQLPKLDWLKKVAEDFPPLPIARWVVYGGQHRKAAERHRRIGLHIDATSAFGTGEHPTTRGCLLMLDRLLKNGCTARSMLDMGCGTAILAMAYAKARHGQAIGIDLDPGSILIAKDNIRANGLQHHVRVALGNGYKAPLVKQTASFDLIMANIFAGPLCRMAYELKQHLRPGGIAILSGLLTVQANRVIAAHRTQGMPLLRHMKIGEWSVLALRRPARAE